MKYDGKLKKSLTFEEEISTFHHDVNVEKFQSIVFSFIQNFQLINIGEVERCLSLNKHLKKNVARNLIIIACNFEFKDGKKENFTRDLTFMSSNMNQCVKMNIFCSNKSYSLQRTQIVNLNSLLT